MRKMVKFALVGATAGAVVALVRALRSDEPVDVVARKTAATAGGTAVVGGLAGLVLERRDRRRLAKRRLKIASTLGAGGLVEVARSARPALEQAARRSKRATRKAAAKAAKAAKPRLEQVAEAAKPRLEQVAEVAKPRLEQVAQAADAAREQASRITDAARPRLEQLGERGDRQRVAVAR